MDYNILLDLATNMGYELAMSGAETFRVEESVSRILRSYGLESEVFAIPNYLIASIVTADGKPLTRMRRIGFHGNDLDAVEKLNALSRAICNRHPEPQEAQQWLVHVKQSISQYSFPIFLLGDFMGAAGFSIVYGCNIIEALLAGICGILVGLVNHFSSRMSVNPFFSTLSASFLMTFFAYCLNINGMLNNADSAIIGALMILVPGLLFTNAMRDIIYGDTNSGVNRIVLVLLIAMAIALGTAASWNLVNYFWSQPASSSLVPHSLLVTCLGSAIGCFGFSILFNIHGSSGLICALGGVVTWSIYSIIVFAGGTEVIGSFWGALFSSFYSEIFARIRKNPAITYLVVSIFPLLPGAGVYYTMNYAVQGNIPLFAEQGTLTAAIAGVMAVGILLASTTVRLYNTWKTIKE